MNVTSKTTKIFEYLVGILATAMVAIGILWYSMKEPDRIALAQQEQMQVDLNQAMTLYAENCSICHGLAGEGIGSNPALDSEALKQSDFASLTKIISRGLYNTSMPAWAIEDGGPLNEYQIGTLVMLIQNGDWQETQDRVVNLGLAPLVPFTTEPDTEILTALQSVEGGEILAQGITLYAQECVACHGADGMGTAIAPPVNDPGVLSQAPESLERTIRSGVPGTLMAAWDGSLSDDEIAALVYLFTHWDEVPTGAIPAPEQPVPVTEESLALGESLFATSCARCHGPEGQGTPRAPALNVKGFLTDTVDGAIQQIITLGVPGTAMPAWGDKMTDAEIQAVVGFIRAWEATAPEVAEPARGGGPWWKSEGSTQGAGGTTGVPPWMRNETGQASSSSFMPSGGSSAAQSANEQTATEQTAAGEIAGDVTTGTGTEAEATLPAAAASHQPGSEAGGLGQGVGQNPQGNQMGAEADAASGQHNQASDQSAGGGGPPWAQQTTELDWWQKLDWRMSVLLGSLIFIPFTIVAIAVTQLRKIQL